MTATPVGTSDVTAADTAWFTDARFGMFVHFGAYSVAARHEWVQMREHLSTEQYRRYVDHFDPDLFDAEELVATAVAAGCGYLVFTTKHHDGFCLWDSDLTDFTTVHTCGRDLVAEYVAAARAAGLRIGLYHSVIDWHHPDFTVDCFHPDRRGDLDQLNAERDMGRYRQYLHGQVSELLNRYGPIDLMFYDFTYPDGADGLPGKGPEDWDADGLLQLTRELQPGIVINNRLGVGGDYVTPEQFQPTTPVLQDGQPVVWEACHTINGSWGYDRDNLEFKDPAQLVTMLIQTVSLGGNLILNVGPTGRGELAPRDQLIFDQIGEWMRPHASALRGCGPAEVPNAPNCLFTQRDDRLYVHVLSWPLKLLHLPGLGGRIAFARMLNDGSEVQLAPDETVGEHDHMAPDRPGDDTATLVLPLVRPDVLVPVIEITVSRATD